MDDYSVWMDGGTLLLVAAEVPLVQRQAVLDSLLYAQLVANKSAGSRFTHYPQWHKCYRQTLSSRGWVITQLYTENKPSSDYSCLAPIQPLQLWLETRYSDANSIVEQGIKRLAGSQTSLECFRQFTIAGDKKGTCATLEVGLVHPGPVISLCSIALKTSAPMAQVGIDQPLAGDVLLGEVQVKALSAVLDHDQFEPQRAQLRKLIASKEQAQRFIQEVGEHGGSQNG